MNKHLLKKTLLALALLICFKAEAGGRTGGDPLKNTVVTGGPSLSYSSPQNLVVGTAISPLVPSSSGVYTESYNNAPFVYGTGLYQPFFTKISPGGVL